MRSVFLRIEMFKALLHHGIPFVIHGASSMEITPDTFASVLSAIQGVLATIGAAFHTGLQFLGALKDTASCAINSVSWFSTLGFFIERVIDGPLPLCKFEWPT